MAAAVEMPKLGNTVEECVLMAWHKQKGDAVATGDVIAEIETDKTSFELTAPTDGVLLETFFEPGALVPVFTTVCVIGAPGESVEAFRPAAEAAPGQQTSKLVAAASRPADLEQLAPNEMPGVGGPELPVAAQAAAGRLSPRARRFSDEHNFHPPPIAGSGPGGRVLEADLRDLSSVASRAPAAEPQEEAVRMPAAEVIAGDGGGAGTSETPGVRLSLVRHTIARRLREGLGSTAQYTLHGSANAARLLAARRCLKALPEAAQITIGDLVICCAVQALLEAPDLNAEFIDGTLYPHQRIHMGFACDTPRGLLVPVIRDSQSLNLRGLSTRIRELTAQALEGTIAAEDLTGGTFTVSNLGSLGVEVFTPILNPPQVAILGVVAIQVKPIRKPDGNIEFIDSIGLSLTVDHQVVDGAPGARFLGLLKSKIEAADTLCTSWLASPHERASSQ